MRLLVCFRPLGQCLRYNGAFPPTLLHKYCIIALTGFSQDQMNVREAIAKICSNFSDDYWVDHDKSEDILIELHAAPVEDGWIGIALTGDLRGFGLGISEATIIMQTISQSGAGIAGAQSLHANVYAHSR